MRGCTNELLELRAAIPVFPTHILRLNSTVEFQTLKFRKNPYFLDLLYVGPHFEVLYLSKNRANLTIFGPGISIDMKCNRRILGKASTTLICTVDFKCNNMLAVAKDVSILSCKVTDE
jgi:hypothetical protein